MFKDRYRIVTDRWNGFEVQVLRWWWPFWVMPTCNTCSSVDDGRAWLADYLARKERARHKVVEYLGTGQ